MVVIATSFVWTNTQKKNTKKTQKTHKTHTHTHKAQVFITNVREIIAKNEVKERNKESSC